MPTPETPCVTIGVPVYRGEAFVAEALRSIQNQTYRNLAVIVALDGAQPEAERACRPFLADSRFRLVVQPDRLGWVGNIDWLMAQVTTPFWYCHPHDDVVDPRYVEVLLEEARLRPEAAVVFGDIAAFGLHSELVVQASVTGDAIARQFALLRDHLPAVAFRGLTRLEALRCAGGLRTNEAADFAADTVWMAAAARWGELWRVPVAMYHKRYHALNEHLKWSSWPPGERARAWRIHCAGMLEQAMLVAATVEERELLWRATMERLVSARWGFWGNGADDSTAAREPQIDAFLEYIRTTRHQEVSGWLGRDGSDIRPWTIGLLAAGDPGVDRRSGRDNIAAE